eukprot:maker-scaffold617_size123379-snap-gene-0.17 protein:Tk03718 transcript:maker-scaffold617_size123379-snap-gene-0.17-mRNA-1 annotation:"hypothetical protein DAPPUDRAFT_313164"
MKTFLVLLGLLVAISASVVATHRDKRLFSLFNVVKFKNDGCVTLSDSTATGTCQSAQECTSQGGSADGNCASGFGVCCLFDVIGCKGDVNQNCTYVRNAKFPTSDSTPSERCSYTFKRIANDLCQIRLDFVTTTLPLDGTVGMEGACGGAGDALTVTSPASSSALAFPPPVCGTLNGQHMYFETGTTGDAGALTIAKGATVADRRWNIKVTYIECTNPM